MSYMFFMNNIEFFGFVVLLSLFLFIKRRNLDITGSFPFLYMMLYKTRLGLDKMSSWSSKHPKVFFRLAKLSAFVGVVGIFLSFIFMIWQLDFIVEKGITQGGGLVLPLKIDSGMDAAVPVFFVPFWYWIIALFILATVHEFAHGVIAERFKVKIKSSGFAFLGVLIPIMPAAFVEPDEESLKKKSTFEQIAVFGAGSTSNFIFGILFLLAWLFVAAPLVDNTMGVNSVHFTSVMNESDLFNHNISSGYIVGLDGNKDVNYIFNSMFNLSVNKSYDLTILSDDDIENTYSMITFENELKKGKGMIGISGLNFELGAKEAYSYLGKSPLYFKKLLFWIWFLNIGIGIMNLLPLWITDGGQITRKLLGSNMKNQKLAHKIYNYISFMSLILIVFTLKPALLFSLIGLFS